MIAVLRPSGKNLLNKIFIALTAPTRALLKIKLNFIWKNITGHV